MLKVRVIPTLLFEGYGLVKGARFDNWRRVGTAMPAIRVYERRDVDELIFVDIKATRDGRRVDIEEIDRLADECFMPLTVGGGVRSVDDVRALLRAGADKVAINTAAVESPDLVERAASSFGSQCVVVSIDAKREPDGSHRVYTCSGTRATARAPAELAHELAARGAGEILLTSIDRDGTMEGYDLDLVGSVSGAVSIPVIASGGAGSYAHMGEALRAGANAVAAASIFHFTEQTPAEAKAYLRERGFPTRAPLRPRAED